MAALPLRQLVRVLREDPKLSPYVIAEDRVERAGKQLGIGSYGSVEELTVDDVTRAGKRLHDALVQRDNDGADNMVRKYVEECRLLAKLSHPKIVQFVGLYFTATSPLPMLVMERLERSLDDVLSRYDQSDPEKPSIDIPLLIKISMLLDVIKGLQYLHGREPDPVVHRDLSAKNVLLDDVFNAKVSDLGNARFVSERVSHTLSQLPGTMVYMPPECVGDHTTYGPKLDIFSFGHLTLYTLSQVFPFKLLPATYNDASSGARRLLARSEVERRKEYLTPLRQKLTPHHPMMQLIEWCLQNDPEDRPSASEVLQHLEGLQLDDPYLTMTRADLARELEAKKHEVEIVTETKNQEIATLWQQVSAMDQNLKSKDSELTSLRMTLQDINEELASFRRRCEVLTSEKTPDSSRSSGQGDHEGPKNEERNVILFGMIGSGKRTIGNRIAGQEVFKSEGPVHSTTRFPGTAYVEAAQYHILTIDTEILQRGYNPLMQITGKFNTVNLFLFVIPYGRYTNESHKSMVDAIKSLRASSQAIGISALVITHCEGLTKELRESIVTEFKSDKCTSHVAQFMGKGIYTVGFPSTFHTPELKEARQGEMDDDAKELNQLVEGCTEAIRIDDLTASSWWQGRPTSNCLLS